MWWYFVTYILFHSRVTCVPFLIPVRNWTLFRCLSEKIVEKFVPFISGGPRNPSRIYLLSRLNFMKIFPSGFQVDQNFSVNFHFHCQVNFQAKLLSSLFSYSILSQWNFSLKLLSQSIFLFKIVSESTFKSNFVTVNFFCWKSCSSQNSLVSKAENALILVCQLKLLPSLYLLDRIFQLMINVFAVNTTQSLWTILTFPRSKLWKADGKL